MSRSAAALVVALLLTGPAEARDGKKIFVSVDMEGIAGVVTGEQLGPQGFEYASFRELMTQEANAAIAAAREGGATEFVVADSHGNGENLLLELLPADVQVVRSWPRPLGMMQGIDSTFDAAISGDAHPDLFEIALGERREAVALHRAALRFRAFNAARRFLPPAFTRATSLGVDVRSCSV